LRGSCGAGGRRGCAQNRGGGRWARGAVGGLPSAPGAARQGPRAGPAGARPGGRRCRRGPARAGLAGGRQPPAAPPACVRTGGPALRRPAPTLSAAMKSVELLAIRGIVSGALLALLSLAEAPTRMWSKMMTSRSAALACSSWRGRRRRRGAAACGRGAGGEGPSGGRWAQSPDGGSAGAARERRPARRGPSGVARAPEWGVCTCRCLCRTSSPTAAAWRWQR
jgi:hypothetical protein